MKTAPGFRPRQIGTPKNTAHGPQHKVGPTWKIRQPRSRTPKTRSSDLALNGLEPCMDDPHISVSGLPYSYFHAYLSGESQAALCCCFVMPGRAKPGGLFRSHWDNPALGSETCSRCDLGTQSPPSGNEPDHPRATCGWSFLCPNSTPAAQPNTANCNKKTESAKHRDVAQPASASVSKTEGCKFESCHPCDARLAQPWVVREPQQMLLDFSPAAVKPHRCIQILGRCR